MEKKAIIRGLTGGEAMPYHGADKPVF